MKAVKILVYTLFLVSLISLEAPAQMADDDPIALLFSAEADRINCKAVQILLSTYDANLNDQDCSKAIYGEGEGNFNAAIQYAKTKKIASDIKMKADELKASLTLDNFEASLNTVLDYAKDRSTDVSASIETQTSKGDKLDEWGRARIASAAEAFNDLLASEAKSVEEDPLAESDAKPNNTQGVKIDQSDDIDWIVWLVVILAALSILMGLLTLLSMRKNQNQISSLKRQVDLMNAEQSRRHHGVTGSEVSSEVERIGARLSEFEDILFELKRRSDKN